MRTIETSVAQPLIIIVDYFFDCIRPICRCPLCHSLAPQPCSYFAKGTCTKGANCAFLHIARPTAADNAAATAALAANNGQAPPVVFDVSGMHWQSRQCWH
jgi:hypothetical protein